MIQIKPLLLILILSQLNRLLISLLSSTGLQWQQHDFAMHAQVVLLVAFAACGVSYRELAMKCTAFGWLGFEIISLAESITNIWSVRFPQYTIAAHVIAAAGLSSWFLMRSYSYQSDELDDVNVFICRRRPQSLQDLILAMIGRSALGGIAVYHAGALWHYHHGTVVKTPFSKRQHYVVTNVGPASSAKLTMLDAQVGTKWRIHKNCITTLYAIIKIGRPIL